MNGLFILITTEKLNEVIANYHLEGYEEDFYKFLIIVVAEHIIFLAKYFIEVAIPDCPSWVHNQF